MSYSVQRAVSLDGMLALLGIEIEYFGREEISVYFDSVQDAHPWNWVGTSEHQIAFSPPVPIGVEVLVKRSTDISQPRHVFSQGAAFEEAVLDEVLLQTLHIAQEAHENATIEEVFTNLNMHGYRMMNVGDPVSDLDAVNKRSFAHHDAQILMYRGQCEAARDASAVSATDADAARVAAEAARDAVYGDLASTAAGKGAELVALDDGESGSLWTTLKGFVSKLLSTAGASIVGWKQSGTGTVERTVDAKLKDYVSVQDFGAIGDGVADDTNSVLAALNSTGAIVDGCGLTYKLTGEIRPTGSNLVVRNAVFDLSSVAVVNGRVIQFSGAFGSAENLTANAPVKSEVVSVGSTAAFTAGGFALLRSLKLWSDQDSKSWFTGQIVRVKTVDSPTQITLDAPTLYDMYTADSAFLQPLSTVQNITFENCTFKGKNASPYLALCFQLCVGARVVNCKFLDADYAGITFEYCVDSFATENEITDAVGAGSSYGIMVANSCVGITVSNNVGRNLRHLVTIGGQRGVCTSINVDGNKALQCRDAGIDSHAAGDYVNIRGNHVQMASGITSDGIIFQGANNVITGNTVIGGGTKGVYWQNRVLFGRASGVIANNLLNVVGGASGTGIAAFTSSGCEIDGLTVSGNVLSGSMTNHVYIYGAAAKIRNIAITGNVALSNALGTSCYMTNILTNDIIGVVISGNVLKSSAGSTAVVAIDANSATNASRFYNVNIVGNVLDGGLYGIDADYCTDVRESGNTYVSNGITLRARHTSGFTMDMMVTKEVVVSYATYLVPTNVGRIVHSGTSALTVTLPDAATFPGRELWFRNSDSYAVTSDASNVIPVDGLGLSNAILGATDGDWCLLKSNGSYWVTIAR